MFRQCRHVHGRQGEGSGICWTPFSALQAPRWDGPLKSSKSWAHSPLPGCWGAAPLLPGSLPLGCLSRTGCRLGPAASYPSVPLETALLEGWLSVSSKCFTARLAQRAACVQEWERGACMGTSSSPGDHRAAFSLAYGPLCSLEGWGARCGGPMWKWSLET